MKQRTFLFVVGDNPYANCHGDYHTRGNGEWHTDAANLEEALQIIFNEMDFPGEATGRKEFIPGISLEGVPAEEVIQVWSDEIEVRRHTAKAMGHRVQTSGLHSGRGNDFGLSCEIKVTDIDKYCQPVRALLAAPSTEGNPEQTLSPFGASVIKYHEIKHEIKLAAQVQKMEIVKKKWEVDKLSEDLEERMKEMQEQIGIFDAYLHGTRHRAQISRGNKGTGRYTVFQNRVFLDEEVSLLGNFRDMDFKDLEKFEQWLVNSGHIWKLLPRERCILATRIRKEKKQYGNPLTDFWNNIENMRNIIWIRDGENVFHVDVEYDFHNAIFPHKDQFDRAKTVVQDTLFRKAFKWETPKNWHGEKLKKGEYDVMGKMRNKPLEEAEPYYTNRTLHKRFHTMEDWLASGSYTELLDRQVMDAINDYLKARNKKMMVFAVIMQGIVDNTSYLDIPKGTDMFSWESVDRYFELVQDYSHGLPFKGWSDKIAPYIDGKVTVGDWIIAYVKEHIPATTQWGNGTSYKETFPGLFKVIGLAEATIRKCVDNEWVDVKAMKPVIQYHYYSKRRHRDDDYGVRRRVNKPINLLLAHSLFVRVPMSPKYAKDILNDREWKRDHLDLVPIMVNYGQIIKAMKHPVNGTFLKWGENHDD
jgi:hypothetical protein